MEESENEQQKDEQLEKEEKLLVLLISSDETASFSIYRGMTENQFRTVVSHCFNKQAETLLSVIGHSGNVINVPQLLEDPHSVLGSDKKNHELTLIFAEDDDPPRKKPKTALSNFTDQDLTTEEKLKRLFTKLEKETSPADLQIIQPTFQVPNIPGVSTSGYVILNDLIHISASNCLNESPLHKWTNILQPDASFLKSGCDNQLILNIAFQNNIRIHALKLIANQTDYSPKTLKLFVNQNYMDFNNIHDVPPAQTLKLTPKNYDANSIVTLNSIKFSKVKYLTLFIEDNQQNKAYTVLEFLQIIGKPV